MLCQRCHWMSLMRECTEELPPNTITAVVQAVGVQENSNMVYMVLQQLREAQQADQVICPLLESKLSGSKPPVKELKRFCSKTKCLYREWDKLIVEDGLLVRVTMAHKQLILPE